MPVYNAEQFLEKSINSILNQTYDRLELLVINDGSTDNSEQIILSFQDKRIRYYKNRKNEGIVKTLNSGINYSKGKYIARMDADDISTNDRLKEQLAFLEENTDIGILGSRIELIDEKEHLLGSWKNDKGVFTNESIKNLLTRFNCIAHPSVMIRAEIIKKNRYNKSAFPAEDWELWLRLAGIGYKFAILDKIHIKYRVHNNSISGRHNHSKEIFNLKLRTYFLHLKYALTTFRIRKFSFIILINLVKFSKTYLKSLIQGKFK